MPKENAPPRKKPITKESSTHHKKEAAVYTLGPRPGSLLLPSENAEEYYALFAALLADWLPQNNSERLLVEQMAVSQWQLLRVHRAQCAILMQDSNGLDNLPLLDRLYQQQARFERASFRAYKELDRLSRIRRKEQKELAKQQAVEGQSPPAGEAEEDKTWISPGLIWHNPETNEDIEVVPPSMVYSDGHSEQLPAGDPRRPPGK
jgi:hypothetical protein